MRPFALLSFIAFVSCAVLGCDDNNEANPTGPEEPTGDNGDLTKPSSVDAGFQLTTGTFDVPAGQEVQRCYFFEVPYDEPVFVNRIIATHANGSHHFNVFRVNSIKDLDGKPGDVVDGGECWKSSNWSDWAIIMNNQNDADRTEWALPEGVAIKLEPREKLMVQSHYVNATTQKTPDVGKGTVNFYRTEESNVEHEMGAMFATNQHIEICPGDINKSFSATCKTGEKTPITIIAANGHFHSRGLKFTISPWDSTSGDTGETFYTSQSWSDPVFETDLNVQIQPGNGIQFTCSYAVPANDCGDPEKECCYTFGPKVETQEHCNAFIYYYPKLTTDVNCF